MNQLEALKQFTVVVADSGDIDSIRQFSPQDATTNPSLILKAATLPQYQPLFDDAIAYANQQGGSPETRLINASDRLAVNIGAEVLKAFGPHLHRSGCPPLVRSRYVRSESAQAHWDVSGKRHPALAHSD